MASLTLPITKYSISTAARPHDVYTPWVHDTRHNMTVIFEALSPYNDSLSQSPQSVLVMKVMHEARVLDSIRVEELSHAANQMILQARSQGLQPPRLSNLPIQAMYQTPRLALWFTAENGTGRRIQVRFVNDTDFATALATLEKYGCPSELRRSKDASVTVGHPHPHHLQSSTDSGSAGSNYDMRPPSQSSLNETSILSNVASRSALASTPNVTDPFLGYSLLPPSGNPLSRTSTTPNKVESQSQSFTNHIQMTPHMPLDRPRSAQLGHGQAQTPFVHTELWRSASVRPMSQSYQYQTPDVRQPQPAQPVQGFVQPAKPWTAPPEISALPSNITPYLPPRRALPFGQRPHTAGNMNSDISSGNIKRLSTPVNSIKAPRATNAANSEPATNVLNNEYHEQTARPSSGIDSDLILLPTSSTVGSPMKSSPSKSIGSSRPVTASSGPSDNGSVPGPEHDVQLSTVTMSGSENHHTALRTMPGQYHRSSSPIFSFSGQQSLLAPQPPEPPKASTSAPQNGTDSVAATEPNNSAGTKKRAVPSAETSGNSPPKKRAPARKRAPKSSTPTTGPATDLDTLLMDAFKDFDVDKSLQDYTSQRPGSGRQNFVNDLICRHLESDSFLEMCENVENAWCMIGIDTRDKVNGRNRES